MATISRFEEIRAWRMAKDLVVKVYQLGEVGRFSIDAGLRGQIRRASVSVMANIAEGFERGSRKEFVRFLYMAKGSAAEVRSHLYVALELGYLPEAKFLEVRKAAEEVSGALSKFIRYLKGSDREQSRAR